MTSFGEEVLKAARTRVGAPFLHHFDPHNLCHNGAITLDSCMETGMDARGYDCSGLVIASVCDALGVEVDQWPPEYRHLAQMQPLAIEAETHSGDALLFTPDRNVRRYHSAHMGIVVANHCVVHAGGIDEGKVEEGQVDGKFKGLTVIPAETMAKLATSTAP